MTTVRYAIDRRFCLWCMVEITGRQGSNKYCRKCGERKRQNLTKIRDKKAKLKKYGLDKIYKEYRY